MTAWLTEESMRSIEAALDAAENEYRPTCESASYGSGCPGPTAASVHLWRLAIDSLPVMIAELRARRASDMSQTAACDLVEARKFAAIILGTSQYTEGFKNLAAAVVFLDDAMRTAKEGQQLSDADRAALAFAWGVLSAIRKQGHSEHGSLPAALAAIDKLLIRETRP